MESTFAAVPASPSKTEELASSVIDRSAPPAANDPEPIMIDKSHLSVVEEPEQITVDKPNLPGIDKPAPLTVISPKADKSAPLMVDNPALSIVDKSGGTWSFDGIGNTEPCVVKPVDSPVNNSSAAVPESSSQPGTESDPIVLNENKPSFITTKASTAERDSRNGHYPLTLFNTDAEAIPAQRDPEGWVDIPGLQEYRQLEMAQKRKYNNNDLVADIVPDKNRMLKELNADLEKLQEEHHRHVAAYEERLQRLTGRISGLEDLHQSKLDIPFGRGHLRKALIDEPKDLRKRKASIDELDEHKIRIGTDIYGRGSVYASLSPSGVRFRRKIRGKKRQKINVDFGDVDLQDSLKGLEESDIKAILEAQKDLEDSGN